MSLENLSSRRTGWPWGDAESFYVPTADDEGDGVFVATPASAGPWSRHLQHAGPPAALAARAIERLPAAPTLRVARVTVDILKPVPVAAVTATARIVRPGRRVELVEALVSVAGEEEPVLRVAAWRVAAAPDSAPTTAAATPAPRLPEPQPQPTSGIAHVGGYMSAVEWRFVRGDFEQTGPATAWARPRIPLVAGEETTPLQRTLLLADSGSGVGTSVDRTRFLAINTDLAVSLHRDPTDEWLCLAAVTTIAPGTTGTTDTRLFDREGLVGTATQTLLVDDLAAA